MGAVAGCLVLSLWLGAAWWGLAPKGDVLARDGYLLAVDDPELLAGQDVVFGVLSLVLGVAVGVWLAARSAQAPLARSAGAVLGSALGSLIGWRIGRFLGPDAIGAGADAASPAPLDVHALGLLAVWPATTAVVGFLGMLVLAWRHPEDGSARA